MSARLGQSAELARESSDLLNDLADIDIVAAGAPFDEGPRGADGEVRRLLTPNGGVAFLRKDVGDGVDVLHRAALEGAGSWTTQYGNAANTSSSGDELVNGAMMATPPEGFARCSNQYIDEDADVVLLSFGANPTSGCSEVNWTPGMLAAKSKSKSKGVLCLRALVAGGPGGALSGDTVNAVDSDGDTALDWAFFLPDKRNVEMAAVLRYELGGKRGAELDT